MMASRRKIPTDSRLVKVVFRDGPLGVTLKKNEDGYVYVHGIVENSQAVQLDIQVGDELWTIGDSMIEDTPLDKEAWDGLIQYVKYCSRPLNAIWHRRNVGEQDSDDDYYIDGGGGIEEDNVEADSDQDDNNDNTDNNDDETSIEEEELETGTLEITTSTSSSNDNMKSPSYISPLICDDPGLIDLCGRLILKEKESKSIGGFAQVVATLTNLKRTSSSSDVVASLLLKEGRKLLKSDELLLTSKGALSVFTGMMKRNFFLMSDILLVTIPVGDKYQVEHIIELSACKIYVDELLGDVDKFEALSNTFQIIFPSGPIGVVAKSASDRECWINAIVTAICDFFKDSNGSQSIGKRHQFLTGTVHSCVRNGEEAKVKEIVSRINSGIVSVDILNQKDEEGYTPLHYACMFRMPNLVDLLHGAGANVATRDKNGFTSLHWAALNLEDGMLSTLCSGLDEVDLLDNEDRTPLQLAVVEGRDIKGVTNMEKLAMCVSCLVSFEADVTLLDENGRGLIHYLAASWQYEPLEMLLEAGANVLQYSIMDGKNALHLAADGEPLKRARGEGYYILQNNNNNNNNNSNNNTLNTGEDNPPEELLRENSVETLTVLLKAGARVNLKDSQNQHPLQLLLTSEAIWGDRFGEAIEEIVAYGGRLINEEVTSNTPSSSSSSPVTRSMGDVVAYIKSSNMVSLEEAVELWSAVQVVDADKVSIE